KTVDQGSIAAPSTLNYTITVENTGNVSRSEERRVGKETRAGTDASLTPAAHAGETANDGILGVGETWTYTVSYAAEQPQIDNGEDIVNVFTLNAAELTGSVSDEATTAITPAPSAVVTKTVDQGSIAAPSTLNYTITVENTGNVS